MIIVAGEIKVADAGEVEKARDVLNTMVAATVKEAGCITYSFAQDIADPCVVRIFERWENQAALDAHMETPHMAAFREAAGSLNVVGLDVKSYDAAELGPVG